MTELEWIKTAKEGSALIVLLSFLWWFAKAYLNAMNLHIQVVDKRWEDVNNTLTKVLIETGIVKEIITKCKGPSQMSVSDRSECGTDIIFTSDTDFREDRK